MTNKNKDVGSKRSSVSGDNPVVVQQSEERVPAPLPCPFCGCLAWLYSRPGILNGADGHRVECEGACHAMTCWWHTEAEAVKRWNRRPRQEELRDSLQKLRNEIHGCLSLARPTEWGNTNIAVLKRAITEADAALAKARGETR